MKIQSKKLSLSIFLVSLLCLIVGCGFLAPEGEDLVLKPELVSGSASVNFRISGIPGALRGDREEIPAGSLRASGTGAKVTLRLILVEPGASSNRVVELVKTVTVSEEGVAEASFQGVPARSAVGEVVIAGGNISGKSHFHGAADLTSGENVMEVSPKGSGHMSDIAAAVVLAVVQTPELLSISIPNLVSRIESSAVAQTTSTTQSVYAEVLSRFVSTQVISETIGRLSIDSTAGKVMCSGAGNWEKSPTDVWSATSEASSGLKPAQILRQGLGGFAYVSWKNDAGTRSAVTKHAVADGSVTAHLILDGRIQTSLLLESGQLILGGSQGGLPVLLRWDGASKVTLSSADLSGFSSVWAKRFPGISASAVLPYAGVEYVEVEAGNSSSLLCVVRNPSTQTTGLFRAGLDGSLPVALNTVSSLGMWANGEDSLIRVSWDLVDAEGVSYNLYWGLSEGLSTQSYAGKQTDVKPPFAHTGLKAGQQYYYLATWIDSSGTEHDVYKATSAKPVQAIIPQGFRSIVAGSGWSFLTKADGTAWYCGNNSYGATGSGLATTTNTLLLKQVARVRNVVSIATDKSDSSKERGHTLFLQSDGTVWATGDNAYGQLGLGNTSTVATPEPVTGLTDVTAIAAGRYFSLALKRDGTVWAWGVADYSQTPGTPVPTQIAGLAGVIAIAAGQRHSLALHQDGTVSGWGSNSSGQLGVEGNVFSEPVKITGLNNVVGIAASDLASLFLKSDGTVWGAGYNNYGTLGVPHVATLPLSKIEGLESIIAVSAGSWATLYLKNDGTVWAGSNGSITQMTDLSGTYAGVSAGFAHYLAMNREGAVMAWGYNGQGQLGDGTTEQKNTPVQMVFDKPVVPPAPVMVNASPRSGRNIISWEGPSATSFRVYWSDGDTVSKDSVFVDVATPTFLHQGLTDGKTYRYAVTLMNAGGESDLSETVQATPGPNRTIADGEWRSAAIWQQGVVPGDTDDAIIEHQVTLNTDQTIRNLSVEAAGRLTGAYGVLRVLGKLKNLGTILHAGGYSTFTTYIHGDFENQNYFHTERLFVQGSGAHIFIHGTDAASMSCPISVEKADATIKAGSNLKFQTCRVSFPASDVATGAIDLAGYTIALSGGTDGTAAFRIDNGEIVNAGGIQAGSMNYMIVSAIRNSAGTINISGTLPITGTTVFYGDVTVQSGGSLTNAWSAEADIRGKLTVLAGGSVPYTLYHSYSYTVKMAGDLEIAGSFSPSSAQFTGTGEHVITTPESLELTGTFSVINAGAGLKAANNLRVNTLTLNFPAETTGILNMNGKTLYLKGGTGTPGISAVTPCLLVNNGKITNVAGLVSEGITYIGGTFENSAPINVDGELKINGTLNFSPGLVVKAGASLVGQWDTTVNALGRLENNGTVTDNTNLDGGLVINVFGDFAQNGTYTPTRTVFAGKDLQKLSVGSSNVLTGHWVDEDSSAGLVAASDICFDQAQLDLANVGSPTGQLDMAGHAIKIQGGFYHNLGAKHGLWVNRGRLTGVSSISVPTAADSQTVFGGTTFIASDSAIQLSGHLQLASTTYFVGDVSLVAGSSLQNTASQYLHSLVTLDIDGNFYQNGCPVTYVDGDSDDFLKIFAKNYSFVKPEP